MRPTTALNSIPGSLRQPDLPAVGLRGEVEQAEQAERRHGEGGQNELAGVRRHSVTPGVEEGLGQSGDHPGDHFYPALHLVNHVGGESLARRRGSGSVHAQNRFDPRARYARAL